MELVTALLIAPVLSGGPQEEGDPHDDSPEGEHGGQDQDPGHDPSIPPGWGVGTVVPMFGSRPVGVRCLFAGVVGMESRVTWRIKIVMQVASSVRARRRT